MRQAEGPTPKFLAVATTRGASLAALMCVLPTPARAESDPPLYHTRPEAAAPWTQVPDFRALAKDVLPAVASIAVEQRMRAGRPGEQGDFFHRYFGGELPREFRNHGLGSGFVIDDSGLLLTNFHVVEDASSIQVTLAQPDGSERRFAAKVLGSAPKYDVALLALALPADTTPPRIAYLGDSDRTEIGDWVMAVGNPFGLSHSVSVGIISAKERRDVTPSGRQGLYNFLQTDASINPGNSGGPLVNMRGEVIGINSAVNAAGSGIGFAIPINMVKEMLPELKSKGRFARSWLGIKIQPLTAELAQSYRLNSTVGALVSQVVADSPAAAAELREGDIVTRFHGRELHTASDLPLFASLAGVGKRVALGVWREGRELTITVTLTAFPDDTVEPVQPPEPPEGSELGIKVADITPELQQQFGLSASRGVVLRDVDPEALAARAGLRAGDTVLSVNAVGAATARIVAETVRAAPRGEVVRFKVSRGGAVVFVAVRKP